MVALDPGAVTGLQTKVRRALDGEDGAGTSPVTRSWGTRRVVLARHARNKRLADAVYPWALFALTASPAARAFYHARRRWGHYPSSLARPRALRALGNHLAGFLHGCLAATPTAAGQSPGRTAPAPATPGPFDSYGRGMSRPLTLAVAPKLRARSWSDQERPGSVMIGSSPCLPGHEGHRARRSARQRSGHLVQRRRPVMMPSWSETGDRRSTGLAGRWQRPCGGPGGRCARTRAG